MIVSDEDSKEHELDVCGLACPLPVLKAKKAIKTLSSGSILTVFATDPSSVRDFKMFCELTGHRLEANSESDGVFSFQIRING